MSTADPTSVARPPAARDVLSRVFGSSGLGIGIVLVLLPAGLLMLGLWLGLLDRMRLVGLPMLAIFGIVLLFGTLALVAMLFQSLDLTDKKEPLALPQGSIRAAIALSLIVLFAIIAIMLFQSMLGSTYLLRGLTKTDHDAIVQKMPERVVDSVAAPCAASTPAGGACAEADLRFDLSLQGAAPSNGASDLAKQLLILVGTLMTSVTSFYFAGRGQMEQKPKDAAQAPAPGPVPGPVPGPANDPAEPDTKPRE